MPSSSARLRRHFCFFLAFAAGFSVMLLEMCAFRVLYTHFGSSMYVTGTLLTLVMVALSAGYYLGGLFSRRFESLFFLLSLLLAGLSYLLLFHLVLGNRILDWAFGLRVSFFNYWFVRSMLPPAAATLLLYAVPMLIFSQTSPYLIRLLAQEAEQAGSRRLGLLAGSVMALSTVGSIAGTLLPSFILIPSLGVTATLRVFLLAMGAVIALGYALARLAPRRQLAAMVMALALLPTGWLAQGPSGARTEPRATVLLQEAESLYGNIKLYGGKDEMGDELIHYLPSRVIRHSLVYPGLPQKHQVTTGYVNLGPVFGARKYLTLGAALGGTLLAIRALVPTSEVTGVEIDPTIVEMARRLFPDLNHPDVHWVVEDARVFLRDTQERYDYVVLDIFLGEQPPPHCISQEFFELVRSRMSDGGILFMNTNMPEYPFFDPPPGEVFVPARHLRATLKAAGFQSIFAEDLFGQGGMYAFTERITREQLQARLLPLIDSEEVDIHLRASLALTYLTALPDEDSLTQVRPYTDDWVPESQVQLKGNLHGFLRALEEAGGAPMAAGAPAQLRAVTLSAISEFVRGTRGRATASLGEFMRSPQGERYCEEVRGALAVARRPWDVELARSFYLPAADPCQHYYEKAGAGPEHAAARWVHGFLSGYVLARKNQAAKALPLLRSAIAGLPGAPL